MTLSLPPVELHFFTTLLILLASAKLLGELFERIGQPSMIGEIIAGILLGPSALNLLHRTESIKVIAELGVFLLVILAGLEINIDEMLKSLKGKNIIISALAFFLPIFSGFAVGYYYGQAAMTAVFIGLCVAITALPVSIRMLMDLGKINSAVGKKIIAVAIFDDVLALTILGVLIEVHHTATTPDVIVKIALISLLKLAIFVAVLFGSYMAIKKVTRKEYYVENLLRKLISFLKGKESLFALFIVFVLIFSTITETLGLHFIVGAFFAAMLVSESFIGSENVKKIERTAGSMAMGFLAPIFFAGIGLEFNFSAIEHIGLLLAVLFVSYVSKIAGGFFGARLAGIAPRQSLTIGVGLNARGIMELVIANIAYKAGAIDTEVFSILVIMGVLTTLTTPFLLRQRFAKFD